MRLLFDFSNEIFQISIFDFFWWDQFWFFWFISRMVHYYSYRELNFRIRFQAGLPCKKVQDTTIFLILDFYSIQRSPSKPHLDESEKILKFPKKISRKFRKILEN